MQPVPGWYGILFVVVSFAMLVIGYFLGKRENGN
jgi:hypothetical protein